jgi:cobalamin transport system substrate-binding protein
MTAASTSVRRARRAAQILILLLPLLALAACVDEGTFEAPTASPLATSPGAPETVPPTADPAIFPVTIVDDEGTEVTVPDPPQRIVSLTPATTEILFAIGAGERVVGKVEDVADYPPEAADVPVVATFAGVDVEQIVNLEADLVVAGGTGLTQGPAVDQLRNAGIPVVVIYPTTVDGAIDGIRRIGLVAGAALPADDLALSMRAQIEAIGAVTQGEDHPRVFYEIDYGQSIFTPPADSIYGEMIRLAGGDPISGNPDYTISLEQLVAADPQIILLGDAAYGATAAQVVRRAGWGGMTAVIDRNIHPVDDVLITRPGPRLVDGLQALLDVIHPGLFDQLPTESPKAPIGTVTPPGTKAP